MRTELRKTRAHLASVSCLLAVLSLQPRHARADASPADKATAQALFDQGKTLLSKGDVTGACPKFEESQRLDPGIGTQFNLATCYERAGRTASAWTLFLEVASAARAAHQPDREKLARSRAAELEPKRAKLTISVPDLDAAEVEVKRDGILIGRAQWGAELPVDPGSHTITASAVGRKPWQQSIDLGQGVTRIVEIPRLAREAPAADVATTKSSSVPATTSTTALSTTSGGRTFAIVLGAAGALGLGAGGIMGLLAKSKFNSTDTHCDGATCDSEGADIQHEAIRRGNAATIVTVAGGALLAGGLVLWIASPPAQEPRVASANAIVVGPGFISLRRTW